MQVFIDTANNKGVVMECIHYDKIASCCLDDIRKYSAIPINVVKDKETLHIAFAEAVLETIIRSNNKKKTVIIMPVGPTGQWEQMVKIAIDENIDLSNLALIQMDEYLGSESKRIQESDPLSFTGFVWRAFVKKAIKHCCFQKRNWIVPSPSDIDAIDRAVECWGGVDIAFAGIGLNGHLAFNEPPNPGECWTDESFVLSSTRVVKLSDTTKATNCIYGTGGELGRVPDYAISIGMKQILEAKRIHVFLDWHWQRYILRRSLLGPISMSFPASFLQTHGNVHFTITEEVAEVHSVVPK